MDECSARLDLKNGVVEFTGSEEFVSKQLNNLATTIEIISQVTYLDHENDPEVEQLIEQNVEKQEKKISKVGFEGLELPETFGEWIHKFKDNKTEDDLALIAAFFTQKETAEDDTNSLQVTNVLKEHGHDLSNTSRSLTRLTSKKLMFQTRKDGRAKYLRVSAEGVNYLKGILR